MMKCLHKHIARMAAALCLLPVSCVKEMPFQEEGPSGALYLQPGAVELTTKTAGDDDRGENALGTYLDVFFTGNDNFWKEYHLTDRSFASDKGELLSVNWRADGFDPDKDYEVYVLVNGPDAAHGTVGSLDALRAITVTDADIYRLQWKTGDREREEPHAYTSGAKRFVMDGYRSWSPDRSKTVQTIDMSASLRRAAAKIVLNVSYDADFLAEIIADEKTPQEPRFKLNNYAACSAAITDGDAVDPAIATTGGWRRLNGYVESDYNYSLTTYSYAFSWGTSAAAVGLDAPYIILSVPLGDDPAKAVNHYYRIPVRPQDVYLLKRNTIYTINVVLNSLGSYKEADAEIPVNLSYQVLEWTKIGSEVTNVETEAVHFFQVSPTEVALRGDGDQSQTFRYYAPTDASITIEAIPTDPTNELDAEATARSFTITQTTVGGHGYQALYIDKDGNPKESSVDGITVNTTKGTITVTSTALANRASKYIRFRVWYDKGETWQEYQDIYIRHFPTDNISSISGWYSYKYDGSMKREYTFDLDEWGGVYDGIEDTPTLCSSKKEYDNADDPDKYDEYGAWKNSTYSYYVDDHTISQSAFHAALPGTNTATYRKREAANSLENAALGSDGVHYYFGEGPTEIGRSGLFTNTYQGADYWDSLWDIGVVKHWMAYTTYHEVTYYRAYARRYYRNVPDYSWVRWIPDSQIRYSSSKKVSDNEMKAKVYENGKVYTIKETASGGTYIATKDAEKAYGHIMYVVQISRTDETYTIGYPVIVSDGAEKGTSQDQVVSPAFRIASQLGAMSIVGEMTASRAIKHCEDYVEATEDGTVYSKWRLPTKAECEIIKKYQGTDAMNIVLGNRYYYSLNGGNTTGDYFDVGDDKSGGPFVRCVRDLTPAEVEALNKIK